MKTVTATTARSDLFNILKSTIKGHRQLRITSKEGNAVLLAEEDFQSIIETAHLMSVPGLLESMKKAEKEIENGETFTMEEVFGE
ncbi:MAG: type II toxin-antitoxin system Phd/YefM family antitoxin [Spirochaetales bacterium]|jgi:PHD/YefM family antitoxin component YafN of YafNO toxin-antitoxin module|nr:type II toxin-antitoxin system Phd/YefM family antitoxin [Spirochaetales bacterium]